MALAATARGTGSHNTSATTFTLSPSGNFALGSFAVLVIAADNAHTGGTAFTTFTVTDDRGNTWTRRQTPLYDPGLVNAGVTGAIFTTPMDGGSLQTGTTITVTFDTATVAKAWAMWEVVPDTGNYVTYVTGNVNTGASTGTPTVTTTSIANGDMVIGGGHAENTDTWADDADTTNGTWSAGQHTGVGTTTSAISVTSQWKRVTAAATQTYNPTRTASNCILSWIQLSQAALAVSARDDFDRADQATFGNLSGGGSWAENGRTSIVSNKGRMTLTASTGSNPRLPGQWRDADMKAMVQVSNTTDFDFEMVIRDNGVNSEIRFAWGNTSPITIQQKAGGTSTSLATFAVAPTAGVNYWMRAQANGTTVRMKVWQVGTAEPDWQATGTAQVTAAGTAGLDGFAGTAVNIDWDDLNFGPIGANDDPVPHTTVYPQIFPQ